MALTRVGEIGIGMEKDKETMRFKGKAAAMTFRNDVGDDGMMMRGLSADGDGDGSGDDDGRTLFKGKDPGMMRENDNEDDITYAADLSMPPTKLPPLNRDMKDGFSNTTGEGGDGTTWSLPTFGISGT